jgi:hypothetical protein
VGEREVADMKEQMETLADTQWDPFKKTVAFRTDEKQVREPDKLSKIILTMDF